ncbi:MAG: hypothetical protein WHS88_12460 [Anaerohalosphaeraceae bacterium]
MQWYEIKLKVHTALGTRLSADTLFGHLCWALRYHEGEAALADFLRAYADGAPPLLLSDVFPDGYWPLPHLPRPTPEQEKNLLEKIRRIPKSELEKHLYVEKDGEVPVGNAKPNEIEAFDFLKWMYKLSFLPDKGLHALCGGLSTEAVFRWFLDNECGSPILPKETVVAHNTISRLTGTTGQEGSLFFTKEWHIDPSDPPVFRLLAASAQYSGEKIKALFERALEGGYGKYKSRGKGKVAVESVSPAVLPAVSKPNAVLLLAACAPAEQDPAEGFWKLQTKIGKLGGDWAVGPHPSGIHDVYKKPLILLTAGSVLKTDSPRPFYGRLVQNIHRSFPEVCQYALAPALPVCCDFTEVI